MLALSEMHYSLCTACFVKKKKEKKRSVRRALCQERLREKFILLIKELRMSFYVLTCYDCDFLR